VTATISRRHAFRVAADVLERSDWLTVDLLADAEDENASENADAIVGILREEARAKRSREELEEALRAMSDAFLTMADLYIAVTSTKEDRVAAALKAERAAGPHLCRSHTYDEAAARWVCALQSCPTREAGE